MLHFLFIISFIFMEEYRSLILPGMLGNFFQRTVQLEKTS